MAWHGQSKKSAYTAFYGILAGIFGAMAFLFSLPVK